MLTLQLFAGSEELPELYRMDFRSQESVDEYLDRNLSTIFPLGSILATGKDFIRACLVHDGEKRMTASQAFRHDWLQKPANDKHLFQRLESESSSNWEPRGIMLPVIEDLTAESEAIRASLRDSVAADTVSRIFASRGDVSPLGTHTHQQAATQTCGEANQPLRPQVGRDFIPLTPTQMRAAASRIGLPVKRNSLNEEAGTLKRRRPGSL